jgi:hypothetical protein
MRNLKTGLFAKPIGSSSHQTAHSETIAQLKVLVNIAFRLLHSRKCSSCSVNRARWRIRLVSVTVRSTSTANVESHGVGRLLLNGFPSSPAGTAYESPSRCTNRRMRYTFWLLIVVAGTGGGQWRRFGEGQPSSARSSVAREMLGVHNAVRARVGMAPLAWSARLAARSQDWADTLQARRQLVHRPNSTNGENLFEITGATAPPPRWSTRGPRNLGTMTTPRTDVAACAGTTRRSSGATPKKWDAQ